MTQFVSARRKVERAKEHIANIETIISTVPSAYEPRIEKDPKTGNQTVAYGVPEAFFERVRLDLAVVIGDAAHNLRTALDHAWIETLTRHAPGALSDSNSFPIRKERTKVEDALNGIKHHITNPALVKRIVSDIQPYLGGNVYIVGLHYLDIADKHQMLLRTLHVGWVEGIVVEDENGNEVRGGTWVTTQPGPYHVDFGRNIHIKKKGKQSFQVMFGKIEGADMFDMAEVPSTLRELCSVVEHVITELESL